MDPEEPDSDAKEISETRRACDQCRLRKIRCDKRSPCANCRSSKIVCRSTGAGQKPPEPRRRVLISSQYEHKIDLIEDRLSRIEDVLQELKSLSSRQPTSLVSPVPSKPHITPTSSAALDQHDSPSFEGNSFENSFEGNSSMAAHSAYASKFLETAVSQSALEMSSPKIGAALSTLRQIVNMQQAQAQASSKVLPKQMAIQGTRLKDFPMPPMQVVLSLCRWATENPPTVLQGYCPFIPVEKFVQKCREVYFAVDDYSDATFIMVNACLYNIFIEWTFTAGDPAEREDCQKYINLCRNNLETALANLSLLMPARDEYIEALALGAIHAIEISKPSFAWTLTSTATRLCQSLGYHRASSMEHDPPRVQETKMMLFWTIYCLDKALSLRLGRSSSIQDYDVTLSPDINLGPSVSELWKSIYRLWIRLARIQGRVYELLYSPTALAQPESDRVAYARQLAAEMQTTVMDPFKHLTPNPNSSTLTIEDFYMRSDQVSRLSTLTLIYRAIPSSPGSSSTFIPECIETARAALQAHQECMAMLTKSSEELKCSYMHWSILYAPFIPFIVLICNVLEVPSTITTSTTPPTTAPTTTTAGATTTASSSDSNGSSSSDSREKDLTHLTTFLQTLQPITPSSAALANLHRLCHVLYSVARLYVDARASIRVSSRDSHNVHPGDTSHGLGLGLGLGLGSGHGPGHAHPQIPENVGMEFDACLSALGLAPGSAGSYDSGGGGGPGPGGGGWNTSGDGDVNQTTRLENWFSGNQYMMGLLEEDLSLIDSSGW